jgi:MFS family permease
MISFGLSTFINDNTIYLVVVFVCRAIQGASSAFNDTTILSITGLLYKEHQDIVITLILMVSGISYTLAPLLGSLLYSLVG